MLGATTVSPMRMWLFTLPPRWLMPRVSLSLTSRPPCSIAVSAMTAAATITPWPPTPTTMMSSTTPPW